MSDAKTNIAKYITLVGLATFVSGLFFSNFALSISLVILVLPVFINFRLEIIAKLIREKLSLFFLIWFLMIAAGYFLTGDKQKFLHDLIIKLPFLVVPIIFLNPDVKKKEHVVAFFQLFIFLAFLVGVVSFVNYMVHKKEIDELILQAKPIPIFFGELNHIYFSFMLAFSIFLVPLNVCNNIPRLRWFNRFMMLSNLIFLHVIAARTGLVAFYITLFVLLILYGIRSGKIIATAIILVVIGVVGFVSVKKVDALNNRYVKTLEDIQAYRNGEDINYYSISMRFEYWDKALKVFYQNPVFGTGGGDVKPDMRKIFEQENSKLEKVNRKGPHNQYFEELAARGVLGFILMLLILLYPLPKILKSKDNLSLSFLIIILVSFGVESVLQRQVGISFFVFFWFILWFNRNEENISSEKK
jgi:O-antigen ligase